MGASKGQNAIYLSDGRQIKITVEQEDGFIRSITIDGPVFMQPDNAIELLQMSLKWVQINPVALYTRIRFFMLKNKVIIQGIDCTKLADAICKCR